MAPQHIRQGSRVTYRVVFSKTSALEVSRSRSDGLYFCMGGRILKSLGQIIAFTNDALLKNDYGPDGHLIFVVCPVSFPQGKIHPVFVGKHNSPFLQDYNILPEQGQQHFKMIDFDKYTSRSIF
jgi:hypothetical protein